MTLERQEPSTSQAAMSAMADGFVTPSLLREGKPTLVEVDDFQCTYRCNHCGHEWNEIRKAESQVNRPEGSTQD